MADGTIWLTRAGIAALFDTTKQNATQHLGRIFRDGELNKAATCKDHLQVQQEGARSVRTGFAEDRAARRQETRMADWIAQTDRFLAFNERDVLKGKGRMSHEQMEGIVHSRFEAFDAARRAAEAEQEAEADLARLEGEARRLTKPDKPK